MKEVVAIIRMNKMNKTKEALVDAGFPAFTATKVMGRGRKALDQDLVSAIEENPEDGLDALSMVAQGPRLLPKRMLKLVVPDEAVATVVETIIKANQTNHPGDGKIFVLPVTDVVRVRTEETGELAIDEMKIARG
ncbi:MAG TPA: P-II family nitrogen regulator [Dissulfuribacter thermophilus]|uniref:P-II family nitrogen regulator n=2 Tax=Dissulfuribacter thermophilus TaxID=1156395 RepID=A0A7V2SW61_9BACT|nr:P-II family nitrogen regulator [Dissulfuribacter thermophilus]